MTSYTISNIISTVFGAILINQFKEFFNTGKLSKKEGDLLTSHSSNIYTEMYADNFPIKHGLPSATNGALPKLYYNIAASSLGIAPFWRHTFILVSLSNIFLTINMFLMRLGNPDEVHGDAKERLDYTLKHFIATAKRANMPEQALKFVIDEYDRIIETFKKMGPAAYAGSLGASAGKLVYKLSNLILQPLRNGTRYDVEQLRREFEQLINNRLYIGAAKLEYLEKRLDKLSNYKGDD